jgi:Tfp pilus assembly protein PilF
VYAAQGRYQLALADFTEALRIDPNRRGGYLGRARIYRALGDEASALVDERKAEQLKR